MGAGHKNQHFVPQFYFRSFSNDQRSICLLHRANGLQHHCAPIKGQASKNYFYGNEEIEKLVSVCETELARSFRELNTSSYIDELSHESLHGICLNIMFQKSRSLGARIRSAPSMDLLLQRYMMAMVERDTELDENMRTEFLKIARTLKSDPQHNQLIEIKAYVERAGELLKHKFVLIENRTGLPFIFGDAPVIYLNPYLKRVKIHGVLGVQRPGIMIFYPVNPSRVLLIYDSNIYSIPRQANGSVEIFSHQDIADINKLQIHNAINCVYYSEPHHSQFIKRLWEAERYRLSTQESIAKELNFYNEDGTYKGIASHSFEPQIPFMPKLRFLEYSEFKGKTYMKQYK